MSTTCDPSPPTQPPPGSLAARLHAVRSAARGDGPLPLEEAAYDFAWELLHALRQARGERRIDLLMLSHRDTDHVGGAESLLAAVPVAADPPEANKVVPMLPGARASKESRDIGPPAQMYSGWAGWVNEGVARR